MLGYLEKRIQRLASGLSSLAFPPVCSICDGNMDEASMTATVCGNCWKALKPVGDNVCSCCGRPLASPEPGKAWHDFKCSTCRQRTRIPYTLVRSLYHYSDPLTEIIQKMKFERHPKLATPLSERLAEFASRWSFFPDCDVLLPVPIGYFRKLRRGYNQSSLLASRVAERLEIPMDNSILVKVRNTRPQWKVAFEKRKKNVRGAFQCREKITGQKIMLVDDVFTSGATVEECCKTLKRAGAASVMVLTLARAQEA